MSGSADHGGGSSKRAACTVAAILGSMNMLLGIMPISGGREWPGFLGMSLTGAAGGWFGGWLLAGRGARRGPVEAVEQGSGP